VELKPGFKLPEKQKKSIDKIDPQEILPAQEG
jgi:hypothetical protein